MPRRWSGCTAINTWANTGWADEQKINLLLFFVNEQHWWTSEHGHRCAYDELERILWFPPSLSLSRTHTPPSPSPPTSAVGVGLARERSIVRHVYTNPFSWPSSLMYSSRCSYPTTTTAATTVQRIEPGGRNMFLLRKKTHPRPQIYLFGTQWLSHIIASKVEFGLLTSSPSPPTPPSSSQQIPQQPYETWMTSLCTRPPVTPLAPFDRTTMEGW